MAGYKILGLADKDTPEQYKIIDEPEQNDEAQIDAAAAKLDNLPQPQGFLSKLPRNILIGLTHAGRNLHNLPHDVLQGFENATQNIAKPFESLPGPKIAKGRPLSSYLPNDETDYSSVFGGDKEGNTLMDNLIQKGLEYAPELIGAGGLIRGGFRRLKGTHQLDAVRKAVAKSGLTDFGYSPSTLREAKGYMPPSQASREILAGSASGEYPASFGLQSQIGFHQRNLAKSPLASERLLAPRVGELKQTMISELYDALRSSGMHKEAEQLTRGINNYRQYTKFKEAVLPVIKKLGIPTSILAVIGLSSKKGKEVASKLID